MFRTALLAICVVINVAAFARFSAGASDYPNRPVKIIVPFAAGGPTDTFARIVALNLQARLGQPFIVENRAGATGAVGTSFVATAPADGYTLLFASNSSHVMGALLQGRKAFDPVNDFRPVSILLYYPMYLVVGRDVPATTTKEFAELAKTRPGRLNFGSPGTGSGGHLVAEMFNSATGIDTVHVPYKGAGPTLIGLMGGEIQFAFDSIGNAQNLVDDGKLRGLAITGRQRMPLVPNVPTLAEAGFEGFEDAVLWNGMLAPKGLPDPIASKLEAELMEIAKLPEVVRRVRESSSVLAGGTGRDLETFMAREIPLWEAVIKKNGISVDN